MSRKVIELPAPTAPYILKSNAFGARMETTSFDREYIRRLSEGDSATQQHFYSYFGEMLYIKLRGRRVRSPQLVEDVRQETFLRVLRKLTELEHPERLGAFVNSVCNNVLLEAFRFEGRFREMGDEGAAVIDENASAESSFVTRERKEQVAAVLRDLPEKDRELLRLIFLEELSKDEVCRRFKVDRDYLRVLLHRARLRFKDRFSKTYVAAP
jgi:RNA polymerase sigma-70 factor (ECF subfamily)